MKNKVLLTALLTLVLISCKKSAKVADSPYIIFPVQTLESPLSELGKDSMQFTGGDNDFIFISDTECSECIMQLLHELDTVASINHGKAYAFVKDGTSKVVNYYIHRNPDLKNFEVELIERPEFLNASIDGLNGRFYKMSNGQVTEGWRIATKW